MLDALKTCNAGMIKLQMSALDTENYDEWLVLGLQTNHMYHLLAHDSQIKDEKKSCIASTQIDVALCSFAKWTKKNKDTHIVHNVKECDDDGAREKKNARLVRYLGIATSLLSSRWLQGYFSQCDGDAFRTYTPRFNHFIAILWWERPKFSN